MIIMINGAFGVGKTTIAEKLLGTIANSMLYDPEEVGFMLRNIITEDVKKPNEDTIYARLRNRGEIEGNWCFQQTQTCLKAFRDPCFEEQIDTDQLRIDEIVTYITSRLNG